MKKENKISVYSILSLLIALISFVFTFHSIYSSKDKERLLAKQHSLIDRLSIFQSEDLNRTKEYADTIKQLIQERNVVQMDGKELSIHDFVKVFEKIDYQNALRKDSIRNLKSLIRSLQYNEKANRKIIKDYEKEIHDYNKKVDSINQVVKKTLQ